MQGEVIGINTAINPRAQGIGFSIPIDKVTAIIDDLKKNGRPSRGWLGVGLSRGTDEGISGALIGSVYENTPAYESGLKAGDIVTSFDGKQIENADDIRLVGSYRAGETKDMQIPLRWEKKKMSVTLGARPSERELAYGNYNQQMNDLGILVADTTGFGFGKANQGVVVLQITKNNDLTKHLRVGDVILKINDIGIHNSNIFYEAVSDSTTIESITVLRNGEVSVLNF